LSSLNSGTALLMTHLIALRHWSNCCYTEPENKTIVSKRLWICVVCLGNVVYPMTIITMKSTLFTHVSYLCGSAISGTLMSLNKRFN